MGLAQSKQSGPSSGVSASHGIPPVPPATGLTPRELTRNYVVTRSRRGGAAVQDAVNSYQEFRALEGAAQSAYAPDVEICGAAGGPGMVGVGMYNAFTMGLPSCGDSGGVTTMPAIYAGLDRHQRLQATVNQSERPYTVRAAPPAFAGYDAPGVSYATPASYQDDLRSVYTSVAPAGGNLAPIGSGAGFNPLA